MRKTGGLMLFTGLALQVLDWFGRVPDCLDFLYIPGRDFLVLLLIALMLSGSIMMLLGSKG